MFRLPEVFCINLTFFRKKTVQYLMFDLESVLPKREIYCRNQRHKIKPGDSCRLKIKFNKVLVACL